MTSPDLLRERYGRSERAAVPRRAVVIALVVFTVMAVAFAAWVAVDRSRTALQWTELGVSVQGPDQATLTFQLSLPPGSRALCAVRLVNDARTEVGRREVLLGPSETGRVRTSVTMRTTEPATAGEVRACVRR
jgi:hypothetical protein